jgi:hypothetical protein
MTLLQSALVPARLVDEDKSDSDTRYRFVDEGLPNYLWMMVARNQFHGPSVGAAKVAA